MTDDFDLKGRAREIETWELGLFNYGKTKTNDSFTVVRKTDYDKLRADLDVAKKALSDHETVYDMLLCEQKKTEQLEEDNDNLSRQVSIYEKALEDIIKTDTDIGLKHLDRPTDFSLSQARALAISSMLKEARAALEEGRK